VYSFICNITGARYIGSSIDIGIRLVQHLVTNNTNEHLQNAIAKYGLKNFTFSVVEFCDSQVLLQREQHYLDILFSLPANLRYNFNPTAGSSLGYKHTDDTRAKISASMTGKTHSEDTRVKMSDAKSGANNPMYGKVPANAFLGGPNNPMYGKVPTHAMTIYIYSLDNVPVQTFSSMTAAAKFLNTSTVQVHRYVRSGKVWNDKYSFRKSS
jgi:group I intron endonuclease